MTTVRTVAATFEARPTLEGAGVHLKRGFGSGQELLFDPFLLFDDFSGDEPAQFVAGFPWHPHRGIETITYLLEGQVDHGDSLGNAGQIAPGDVQWMTAGSGIIHQEMPAPSPAGKLVGFQLWANLPAAAKMMPPRYRGLTAADIPVLATEAASIRIISGAVDGVEGPVRDIVIAPEYLDVTLQPLARWTHPVPAGHTQIAYLFRGSAACEPDGAQLDGTAGTVVLFGEGDTLALTAGAGGARLLLFGGRPLREPIAWRGPIVMNSQAELRQAFEDYRAGRFVR
ncbi:MAG: pirin family protein [Chloroflexi bacterium]|nr:pirin family protein [Chloroflexota bacterium]